MIPENLSTVEMVEENKDGTKVTATITTTVTPKATTYVQMTIEEMAGVMGVNRDQAYKLFSFARDLELVKVIGTKVKEGAKRKNRGADVFEFDPLELGGKISLLLAKLATE